MPEREITVRLTEAEARLLERHAAAAEAELEEAARALLLAGLAKAREE